MLKFFLVSSVILTTLNSNPLLSMNIEDGSDDIEKSKTIKIIENENMNYSHQVYSDFTGSYDVKLLLEWVEKENPPTFSLDPSIFLPYIQLDTWGEEQDNPKSNLYHMMEKEDEKQRVLNADLSFPILVKNDRRVIDGVHRICRAIYQGTKNILVRFIDTSTLNQFRISMPTVPVSTNADLPIPDIYLRIPLERLPADESARRDIIETYFSDHLPSVVKRQDSWIIQLERPQEKYGCYKHDCTLQLGLEWWEKGTKIHDIPLEKRILTGGLLAVEDQWIPYSWSLYFEKQKSIPKEIILLHLDDHQDMMIPRLGSRPDGHLYDLITGDLLSLLKPNTVKDATLSGAIGKGSILLPLIWSVDKIHIRHLTFRPHSCSHYHVDKVDLQDGLLSELKNRTGLQLTPTSKEEIKKKSNYVVSASIEECLNNIPEDIPILFHIDMDYFNNRYDGCSDWETQNKRNHDTNLQEQLTQIEKIFQSIKEKNISKNIVDTSIGISAGFYPGEFWSITVPKVLEECKNIGLQLTK